MLYTDGFERVVDRSDYGTGLADDWDTDVFDDRDYDYDIDDVDVDYFDDGFDEYDFDDGFDYDNDDIYGDFAEDENERLMFGKYFFLLITFLVAKKMVC